MAMKRQSLKLDEIDWQALTGIAADCGCEYRGEPSWRRLIDHIASGKLTVVDRPNKRIQAFQEKMRRPGQEQRVQQVLANITAKEERDRPLALRPVALRKNWRRQPATGMSSAGSPKPNSCLNPSNNRRIERRAEKISNEMSDFKFATG